MYIWGKCTSGGVPVTGTLAECRRADSFRPPTPGAVTTFGQMQRVFVVADNRAVLRLVKTGQTTAGVTTILAGLNPGETVVINPSAPLRDGQPLAVSR